MATNGYERRLAFLEKAYLEDRERWARADEKFETLVRALLKQDERLGKFEKRMVRLDERIDATLKILKRLAER